MYVYVCMYTLFLLVLILPDGFPEAAYASVFFLS